MEPWCLCGGSSYIPTTIIAAITGAENIKKPLPILVFVPSGSGGLTKDSYINLGQIRTIDKTRRIIKKLGSLDDAIMESVNTALKISLDLH